MSRKSLTRSEYTRSKIVETFVNLVQYNHKRGLPHIFQLLLYCPDRELVQSDVPWYIATGLSLYKEPSDERLWKDEAEWSSLIIDIRFSLGKDEHWFVK